MLRRFLAMFLAMTMVVSMLPNSAFAAELEDEETEIIEETEAPEEENEPETEPEETEPEETESEETEAPEETEPEETKPEETEPEETEPELPGESVPMDEPDSDEIMAVVASGSCGTNLTWTLDDNGTLTISGIGAMYNYSYSGSPWYSRRSSVKTVVIEDGVTSIGSYAFYNCSNVESLSIGSVEAWCGISFGNVYANPLYSSSKQTKVYIDGELLKKLVIPDGITEIKQHAFRNWDSITSVTIPDSVTSIGSYAFYDCSSLTSVTIPESVTSISSHAFYRCSSLTALNISSLESWLKISFDWYSNPLHYAAEYEEMETKVYADGVLLEKLVIPEGTEEIPEFAFTGWTCVREVTIPASVKQIGREAFYACWNVEKLYLDSIEAWMETKLDWGSNPLCESHKQNRVYVNGQLLEHLVLPEGTKRFPDNAFDNWRSVTSLTLPEGIADEITCVDGFCLPNLRDLYLPDIETYLNLRIDWDEGIYDPVLIFNHAYEDHLLNLYVKNVLVTDLVVPDSVTILPEYAFNGTSIRTVTIPAGVKEIGLDALNYCSNLTAIYVAPGSSRYQSVDGVLFSEDEEGEVWLEKYPAARKGAYEIPGNVQVVRDRAFYSVPGLTALTIPDSVTYLGYHWVLPNLEALYLEDLEAFFRASYTPPDEYDVYYANLLRGTSANVRVYVNGELLTDLVFPEWFGEIGYRQFANWKFLQSVTIPGSVRSISERAFENCSSLHKIIFTGDAPGMYWYPGDEADGSVYEVHPFDGITAIAWYPGGNSTWTEEVMRNAGGNLTWKEMPSGKCGDHLTWMLDSSGTLIISGYGEMRSYHGDAPWVDQASQIRRIILPQGLTSIGSWAFAQCISISTVDIPDSVESIEDNAFRNCTYLKEIRLPSNLSSIEEDTFYNCNSLREVILPAGLESIGRYAFYDCSSLREIEFPEGLETIGIESFYGTKLQSIRLPDSVRSVDEYCFEWIYPAELDLGNGIEEIGRSAFNGYSGIVHIPESVQTIYAHAFSNAKGVVIHGMPPVMNQNCFQNASIVLVPAVYDYLLTDGMKHDYAPNAVWATYGTNGVVDSGTVGSGISWVLKMDGKLSLSGRGAIPDFSTETVDYRSVTKAPWGKYAAIIDTISIGSGITGIGENAFYGIPAKNVQFAAGLKTIGKKAFYYHKFAEIILPNGVTTIGESAFSTLDAAVKHMVIPGSVTTVGSSAFEGMYAYDDPNSGLVSAGPIGSGCNIEFGWKTKIPDNAFAYIGRLKYVTIPDTITEIGKQAFCFCGLKEVSVGKSVKTIGDLAFSYIGSGAEVTFTGNAPNFGNNVFYDSVITAYYPKGNTTWKDSVLKNYGGTVTWAAKIAELVSGTIESIQWKLDGDGRLVLNGTGDLPDFASVSGASANSGAPENAPWSSYRKKITEVVVGAQITGIGANAFAGCTNLKTVTFRGDAPRIQSDAFSGVSAEILYRCDAYGWSHVANKSYGGNLVWTPEHLFVDGSCAYCGEHAFVQRMNILMPEGRNMVAVGDSQMLTVQVYPEAASGEVAWSVTNGTGAATITSYGALRGVRPGTVTVFAEAKDGSGVTAALDVQVMEYAVSIDSQVTSVTSGSVTTLKASLLPYNLTETTIVWSLAEGDDAYASITADGKLTAKKVTEPHTITVLAASEDEMAAPAQMEITVYPAAASVAISMYGTDVTGKTITADVNTIREVTLTAAIQPESSKGTIEWTTADTTGKYGAFRDNGDGTCTVSDIRLPAASAVNVALTAKVAGTSVKSTVVLKIVSAPKAEDISTDVPGMIRGGTKVQLKALVSSAANLTDSKIGWKLRPCDEAFASVNAKGKLTTKVVAEPVEIVVTAYAASAPDSCVDIPVLLVPAAESAVISADLPINDGTIAVDTKNSSKIQLTASVEPASAIQTGTWKSSSARIAKVDAEGRVTFYNPGTVKITFTTSDGTKKSTSVKLVGGNPARGMSINGADALTSGGKTTLTAVFSNIPTVKTVTWSSSDASVATVSAKGVVTAKTVFEEKTVTITAKAADGSGEEDTHTITVSPKADVLTIRDESGKAVNNSTVYVDLNSNVRNLTAPAGTIWTSSAPKVAVVNDGVVHAINTGSATITAKSADGTQTGKVTVKISALVTELSIITDTSVPLISGKGKLTLKTVVNADAAMKTLTWTSSNPSVAAVSASGAVTAKAGVTKNTQVTIRATAKDGSGKYDEVTVTVIPAAKLVNLISQTALTTTDGIRIASGEVLNGRTITLSKDTRLQLGAIVYPNWTDAKADQNVTWKSSSTAVAEIKDGVVTAKKAGSVTITVKTADGKTNTVKLKFV